MAKVNLLPWRSERRKVRQREFYVLLGGAGIGALVLGVLISLYYSGQIDGQNKRNYKAAVNSNGAVTSEEFYFYGVSGQKIGNHYLQTIAVGGTANLTLTFTLVNPVTGVNGPAPLG